MPPAARPGTYGYRTRSSSEPAVNDSTARQLAALRQHSATASDSAYTRAGTSPSSTAAETEEETESQQALMPEPTRRCAAVRHDLLMARREAAAADAAVAAVVQVLKRRQDLARKAHTTVVQAERQLEQLTEDTTGVYCVG
ncbi:MAG: hypothetical protein FRX49_12549 [Trebouxia sp. A1-2]|nr:MAG: hypothetical protein FRX49_12549 [Trebouxia sp. A1-2]